MTSAHPSISPYGPWILPESPAATYLNNTISANTIYLDPTHHQLWRDSRTWIDLFIVGNLDCLQSYSKSSAPFIAAHNFIEIALAYNKPPLVERWIQSRELKEFNPESMCQALSHHLPTPDPHAPFIFHNFIATTNTSELVLCPCPTSVDTAERILKHAFTHAIDTVAPLRKLILSSRRKPWVNPQIRALMRSRDRAYRLARASGTPTDHDRFHALHADTSNALDSAKNRYVASRLADAPSANVKWLELRRLRVTKPLGRHREPPPPCY